MSRFVAVAYSVFAVAACAPVPEPGPMAVMEFDSPAGAGTATPYLAARDGVLYVSWLEERPGGGHVLRFSSHDGSGWEVPRAIAADVPLFANWADFPSLLPLEGDALAAHWLQRSADGRYAYHVRVSRSLDGGRTWSDSISPHVDRSPTEHGFVSLVGLGPERFGAVWLDGRAFVAEDEGAHEMALRFATFEGGAFGQETVLDPRVCDCCQTTMIRTEHGLFVAYRDRSESEVRDISYVRRVDGNWTEPRTLHADGWEIAACPVNGPAAAADGDRLAVAWFTAPVSGPDLEVTPRVLVAFSDDAGATFDEPVRVDGGHPAGRVDVEWLPGGGAAISWIERTQGGGAEVRVRRVDPDGTAADPTLVASTSAERSSGFPRMARRGADVVIGWTEPGVPSRVRLARLGTAEPHGTVPAAETDGWAAPDVPAVDLIGTDLNGREIRLSALRGKVVLLDFWGTWCPPCRREIPELIRLHQELQDRGLEIVAVNSGDPPEIVPAFIEEHRIPYPVLLDDGTADRFGVVAYPTHFVVDRNGTIRHRQSGAAPEGIGALRAVLVELLAESSS